VHLISMEDSPEGVTVSTLAVSTVVGVALAFSLSGSTVVLPKGRWVSHAIIVVTW
jgi:hypothetical protein